MHDTGQVEVIRDGEELIVDFHEVNVVATDVLSGRGDERPVHVGDQVLEDIHTGRLDCVEARVEDPGCFRNIAADTRCELVVRLDDKSVVRPVEMLELSVRVVIADAQQTDAVSDVRYQVEYVVGHVLVERVVFVMGLVIPAVRDEFESVLAREDRAVRSTCFEAQPERRETAEVRATVAAHANAERNLLAVDGENERVLDADFVLPLPTNRAQRTTQRDVYGGIVIEQCRCKCRRSGHEKKYRCRHKTARYSASVM